MGFAARKLASSSSLASYVLTHELSTVLAGKTPETGQFPGPLLTAVKVRCTNDASSTSGLIVFRANDYLSM